MKINLKYFCIFLICFYYSNISVAAVFTSKSGGDFESTETWVQGQVPGELDDVIIKHAVFINLTDKKTIKSLSIVNDGNLFSGLEIKGTDSLVVLNNIEATSTNSFGNVYFTASENATLIVNGNCNFLRETGNTVDYFLTLTLQDSSKTFINGTFTFDYNGSGQYELIREIIVKNKALLDVTGESKFSNSGGNDFNFILVNEAQATLRDSLTLLLTSTGSEAGITLHDESSLQLLSSAYVFNSSTSTDFAKLRTRGASNLYIQDNVYLESLGAKVKLEAEGTGGVMTIAGDIIMNASAEDEAYINIIEQGKVYLGGNLIRQTNFGNLTMEDDATFVFNGSNPQTIPESKLLGSGTDSLFFKKISLENTSSQPFSLTENLIIQDTLILTSGNIKTDSTAMIILEDSAAISGGSSTAYIEGPIQKIGRTGGNDITFPIGTSSAYAPITLSEITNDLSDITVQYYSEPPPFGVEIKESGIDNVSTNGYWSIEKNVDPGNLDVTLNWESSAEAGITEMDDLVVVGWDGSEWKNYGQESSGALGSGGFVTSLYSEPPPFGVEALAIGSTSGKNALPVELKKFEAIPQTDRVYLEWQTGSEINTSHFVVERSKDGNNFEQITTVTSKGGTNTATQYTSKDLTPYDGLNYYRLRMVDNDGSYEYSKLEVVKFVKNAPVLIYPNPVKKVLFIEAKNWQDDEVTLEIFDRSGNRIYENNISFENGKFQIATDDINVSSWGTYIVRITGKTESQVLKFVKTE